MFKEFWEAFPLLLVLKRVHPIPSNALENPSIDSIFSPVRVKISESEVQCQLLLLKDSIFSSGLQSFFKKTNLKHPLERLARRRRWERDAVVKEGNGRGTLSLANDQQCDDDDDEEEEEEEEEDWEDDGGDGDGHEKIT